ncbi:MAG TPA: cobalt ECF transporter T component CbiQ [Geobacteraceae bacterium]|nr:cobalt ECF transporter T component CbiQ [Geobacteraceae bacterium]
MHHLTRQTVGTNHPLVRIDPRVKLISALTILVMVISGKGFFFPVLVTTLSLALCLYLGVRSKHLLLRFAEPLFIAVMVILLKFLFSGQVPLFSFRLFGFLVTGHGDGLTDGLLIASRIVGAVSITALLGFSTSFTDLMGALAWFRVPACFIEVALFAWRYLFLLFDDALVIYSAQKNRLGYAGFVRGARSFGTLAGALVIKAFDSSQSVSVAMAQRGYDGTMPLLRHRPFRASEILCSMGFLAIMAVIRVQF